MAPQAFQLALQHYQAGRVGEAERLCRQVLAEHPAHADALHLLGVIAGHAGHLADAENLVLQAIAAAPRNPAFYSTLGIFQEKQGKIDQAITSHQHALNIEPNYAQAHHNLGIAWRKKGEFETAIGYYRKALELKPDFAEAHCNLANALAHEGQVDPAFSHYQQALALKPNLAEAHNNLGNRFKDIGQIDEAIACYRRALAIKPDYVEANSNILYALNYHPDVDVKRISEEHGRWNQRYAARLKRFAHSPSNRSPDGRLRIGYLSPFFFDQAESFFTVPLLANHDHAAFEIFCYSDVINPDQITARLRNYADVWREVCNQSDESVAQIIYDDHVDILIDLTMHMAEGRPLVFARKPAPVQACWLAYPGTTGLTTMDYRITDSFMDPPDADTSCYSESSIRLPDCWVVYDPLAENPPHPPERTGRFTFGSLNNPAKINDAVIRLWGRLLQAVPESRLLLQAKSQEHRHRIASILTCFGVTHDRLEFVGWMPRSKYLSTYGQIDIALDPLPYNGITTTCDSLYMGTPVLTLAGQTTAGRAGQAILNTIGLEEFVAHTPDEFVETGSKLANDVPRLIKIRRTLRFRLAASPLMDAPRFARNMEAAYQQMWQACSSRA
jgi:protein O-GlcNAc transferase